MQILAISTLGKKKRDIYNICQAHSQCMGTSYSLSRFHVTITTQFYKYMVYFNVFLGVMENLGVPNANQCTNFDVKSGLRPDFTSQLELRLTSSCFILS